MAKPQRPMNTSNQAYTRNGRPVRSAIRPASQLPNASPAMNAVNTVADVKTVLPIASRKSRIQVI